MIIKLKDLRIEYFKSSGPGGQHKNKRFTAVRITHIPTGILAVAQEQRSQTQNKEIALERLKEKIAKATAKKRKRIPTSLPHSMKNRILEVKKIRGKIKQLRAKIKDSEW